METLVRHSTRDGMRESELNENIRERTREAGRANGVTSTLLGKVKTLLQLTEAQLESPADGSAQKATA